VARTRAAALHRSHRSARVNSGLVNVAFMASPFCLLHCLRCQRFWPSSPPVYRLCRFSPLAVWPSRQDGGMSQSPSVLVHLCPADDWSAAQAHGELRPESLASVGFVHLSTPEQVHLPANRLYRGREDLVLLHIDPNHLDSPIRWELGVATDPESMLFPHLYGALPVGAVISVTSYRPGADGIFPPVGGSVIE
jgi:uncharacterized protein (DUF952 family)